jgi:hypothetical protein
MIRYQKILIACNTINWLALRTNLIIDNLKPIEDTDSVIKKLVERDEKLLDELLAKLCQIVEEVANNQDAQDALSEGDEAILNGHLDVLNDRVSL